VNLYRPTLIIAGAACTGIIAFANSMKHTSPVLVIGPALLVTYAIGLGLGWLVFKRGR
jgi:hypothetical protein